MSTSINTNGQARKNLADQIDRLDGMLDGLSDGLNEAVADAVKNAVGAAVQQAVQAVLREVLSKPELLARIEAAPPAKTEPVATPPQAPKIGWKERWASVRKTMAVWSLAVRAECGRRLDQARRCVAGAWACVRFLSRMPYLLLTAAIFGVLPGFATSCTRKWWSKAVRGVGWLAATMALQVWTACQRLTTLGMAALA